jgi:hypothetical protein
MGDGLRMPSFLNQGMISELTYTLQKMGGSGYFRVSVDGYLGSKVDGPNKPFIFQALTKVRNKWYSIARMASERFVLHDGDETQFMSRFMSASIDDIVPLLDEEEKQRVKTFVLSSIPTEISIEEAGNMMEAVGKVF